MSERRKVFSAVRWTTLDTLASLLLRLVSVGVLARILVPEDYGLMAMVGVVLGFAGLFSDLGLNSAFVQRREVTTEQRSSLFWMNVSVSAGLAMTVVIASPVAGHFFGDDRLSSLLALSSVTFVLGALGLQVRMAAEKELNFNVIVIVDLVSSLLGFVIAVSAALSGWGALSLVVGGITETGSRTSLYWIYAARGWRPMRRMRIEDIKPFLAFGSAAVGNNIVNYVNRTVDVFLGGRLLAVSDLGIYSVPRTIVLQLSGMVNAIITRVGFPMIAQVQSDLVAVRSIYLKTVNMTSSTNAPIYIGMAFFAPEIVFLILGPGWEQSGELLRILAVWGGLRSTLNPVGSLLYGMGRAGLSLSWNMALLVIVPPTLWLASGNGPEGMAYALLFLQIALFVPSWYILIRPLCGAKIGEYSQSALVPFVLASLAISPAYFFVSNLENPFFRLFLGISISAPLYLAFSYLSNRAWVDAMLELIGLPLLFSKNR